MIDNFITNLELTYIESNNIDYDFMSHFMGTEQLKIKNPTSSKSRLKVTITNECSLIEDTQCYIAVSNSNWILDKISKSSEFFIKISVMGDVIIELKNPIISKVDNNIRIEKFS